MSTTAPFPRASLLGIPVELLDHILLLSAPSPHDQDHNPDDWHHTLHKVAKTCKALFHAAKPLRRRHLVVSVPSTVIQPDQRAHYVHLKSDRRPVVVPSLVPSFINVRSLRLYLQSASTAKVTMADRALMPRQLDELELLDVECEPDVADQFISADERLETVHVTPIRGANGQYVPCDALALLPNLEFLQYGPTRVGHTDDELLEPNLIELSESLVYVFKLGGSIGEALHENLRRLVVPYREWQDRGERYDSVVPDQLHSLASFVEHSGCLEDVALPRTGRTQRLTADAYNPYHQAVQLAFNSIINAPVLVGLCDELRSGWTFAHGEMLDSGDELPEWPGSWEVWGDCYSGEDYWPDGEDPEYV
ncbi:hypothetical protein JCM8208_006324 [Rhodotorula glutinis]